MDKDEVARGLNERQVADNEPTPKQVNWNQCFGRSSKEDYSLFWKWTIQAFDYG